jgi:hypothetical protein
MVIRKVFIRPENSVLELQYLEKEQESTFLLNLLPGSENGESVEKGRFNYFTFNDQYFSVMTQFSVIALADLHTTL